MSVQGAVTLPLSRFNPGNLAHNLELWITEGDATSTKVVADTPGGGITFGTDTTDNDCSAWYWGGESVSVTTVGNRFGFTAKIRGTDGTTASKRNFFIGFADTGVDVFGDTGAIAVFDAIGFTVHEDSNFFRSCIANAGVNGTGAGVSTTAYATATDYVLELRGEVKTTGICVEYFVDGTRLDTGNITGISKTSFGDMAPYIVIANGAAQIELLTVKKFVPWSLF
jgi:hypothetical protein